jgi:hypothetical protein
MHASREQVQDEDIGRGRQRRRATARGLVEVLLRALITTFSLALAPRLSLTSAEEQPALADPPVEATTYEVFPLDEAGDVQAIDMEVDEGGTLWVVANRRSLYKLFYWNGQRFQEAMAVDGGLWLYGGGQDRGLYVTRSGYDEQEPLLYRLHGGAVAEAGTFHTGDNEENYRVYVSKSGLVINWGDGFLACRSGSRWQRIEARLTLGDTLVFDLGDEVYLYRANFLYCADSAGHLREHACPQWALVEPNNRQPTGALWAGRRALLIKDGVAFAFDLPTGEVIDVDLDLGPDRRAWFQSVLAERNGDVWVLGTMPGMPGLAFFRLTADGALKELPLTHQVPGGIRPYPASALVTSTGEILMGKSGGGLAVYRDGSLSVWDWRHGLTGEVRRLAEDGNGGIWFPLEDKMARMRLAAGPPPLSPLNDEWEVVPLMGWSAVWPLGTGEVAMFRKDQPDALSRWNGHSWRHQPVPFGTVGAGGRSAVDDQGHLLVNGSTPGGGYFDIGPDSVERFDTMEGLLQNAVARGVRAFPMVRGFSNIFVSHDGHIWFGYEKGLTVGTYEGSDTIRMFDGNQWSDAFSRSRAQVSLLEFSADGALLGVDEQSRSGGPDRRLYRCGPRQAVDVTPTRAKSELMAGPNGIWPYDRALVDRYAGRYFPILKWHAHRVLFFRPDEFEGVSRGMQRTEFERALSEDTVPAGLSALPVPWGADGLRGASSGGVWGFGCADPRQALRILGETVRDVNLAWTPVSGHCPADAVEDGRGGLWFRTAYGNERAYRLTLPHLDLRATPPTGPVGRELALDIAAQPHPLPSETELFARVDDGPWMPVQRRQERFRCVFRFPSSGKHRCEVAGFRYGGRAPGGIEFDVEARVDLPDTLPAGRVDGLLTVEDLEWKAPIAVSKTREDAEADVLWAVDNGGSRETAAEGALFMADVEAGRHTLRFAAREDGFWKDETPLELTVDYRPDYEKYVARWVPGLLDADGDVERKARTKLIMAGPGAIPALKAQVNDAGQNERLVRVLDSILREIREQ